MTNNQPEYELPDLSARQLVGATLVIGLVILGFWLLFRFHQVVLILMAGIILSLAMQPAVSRLKARRIPPGLSVALLYGLILVAGLLFIRFGAPVIGDQASRIGEQLTDGYSAAVDNLQKAPNLLIQRLVDSLPDQLALPLDPTTETTTPPPDESEGDTTSSFEQVWGYAGASLTAIFQIAAIFLLGFFWTLESDRIKRSVISLSPYSRRDSFRELFDEIEQRVSGYILGQSLLSVIIGTLAFVAYLIIGLPYAIFLALFVAIMEFIPLVGPLIGAIPAIIIGLSISPLSALWVVLAALIIHQLESNVFGPRVMKRTLDMRPLVTLLALTAFGSLFGVLGALVALPLAAVLQLLFSRYVESQSQSSGSTARDRVGVARYETRDLIDDVRKLLRKTEEDSPDETKESQMVEDRIEAIATDLDTFLGQYDQTTENA